MMNDQYITTSVILRFLTLLACCLTVSNERTYAQPSTQPTTQNWLSWRGPTADGRAADTASPPIRWNQNENIAWVTDLPGEGSSTPIVVGEQIFLLTAIKTDRKSTTPVVKDERAKTVPEELFYEFVLLCIDRKSGKIIWQKTVTEEVPHEGKHETNTYAAGSPISDGERLYFSFGSRGIFCYSLAGDLIWKVNLGQMRTRNGWGEAITPALTQSSVIINWDQEENSYIIALDKTTGQANWKIDRPNEVTSWNTPFITTFAGAEQVIVNGTASVKSYAAADGNLLWECGGQTVNAIPSPLRYKDFVICMSGYRGAMACSIPLSSQGNVTDSTSLAWKVTQSTPYVPSPILSGERLLFTAGNTNVLSCIDANTGKPLLDRLRVPGLRTMYASPIYANGHFYFTSREGVTTVLKDNETLDVVSVNELDDVIDASPVAVDNQLLLRSWTKLYCIQNKTELSQDAPKQVPMQATTGKLVLEQQDLETTIETSANASFGDIDGDGDLDIVLAKGRHWPLDNMALFNNGQGGFSKRGKLGDAPDRTYATAVGDIDRDGDLDMIVSNDRPDQKKILSNDGTGAFTLTGTWGSPAWNTRNSVLADLNGDQYPDLLVANRQSASYLLFNDGKGLFPPENQKRLAIGSATTIVGADFNGDGLLDIAVPHRDAGASLIFFNDDTHSFQRTTTFGPRSSSTRACATGDLNGDGNMDLVVGDDRLGGMICLNDGKGNFPNTLSIGPPKLMPYAIVVADMNQDKYLDIVVGYAEGGSRLFLNEGKGTAYVESEFGDGKGSVYGMATGDVNTDGRLDIVQARSDANNILLLNRNGKVE
jgi:outer membrane protein assembly factor BamB